MSSIVINSNDHPKTEDSNNAATKYAARDDASWDGKWGQIVTYSRKYANEQGSRCRD